jgi:hypothetical protein
MAEESPDLEPRRHSFLQEEARMLGPIYRAAEALGQSWRRPSLCSELVRDGTVPPDIFFAEDGTDASETAASICFDCPVRQQCLKWACSAKQRHGIWGGLPASVRLQRVAAPSRGKPHDYASLVTLPNPYLTDDARSRFHHSNVTAWEGQEDD